MNWTRTSLVLIAAVWVVGGCAPSQPIAPPTVLVEPVVSPAPIPPKSQWSATATESDSNAPALYACDGKMDTRWSSPYSAESASLVIDLGQPATMSGCTIHWEAACGIRYQIQTSLDGTNWTTACEVDHGDGAMDDLFFAPVNGRYIRMVGIERVNPWWGYSIWEFEVKGKAEQVDVNVENQDKMMTLDLFDGRLKPAWKSPAPPPCRIDVDLRREIPLGGVWIDWGENYGTQADLFVSRDGKSWEKAGEMTRGMGLCDTILHPRKDARYLRLEINGAAKNAPVEIREISLCSPDGNDDPYFRYRFAAKKHRRGLYPLQFLKEQVYWTLIGLPGDTNESLLDEYGNFEPKSKSCSLMPYLQLNGRIVLAVDADRITHRLEKNYLPLPALTWEMKPITLAVQGLARGTANTDSASYVLYTLKNVSDQPQKGRFLLVVRPVQVNPTWQYGGMSSIESIEFKEASGGMGIHVSNKLWCVAWPAPAGTAARAFEHGDIMEDLARGDFPQSTGLTNAGKEISGALAYDIDLAPGQQTRVLVAAPLHTSTADVEAFGRDIAGDAGRAQAVFEREREKQVQFWSQLIDKVTIELPQQDVADAMKAQVSYMMINRDGPAIQPGSRNYKRTWMRDGCLTGAALLRMGFTDEVREYLDWYAARVQTNGWVPPILHNDGEIDKGFGWNNEYDSQGEFVFAVMEYYRFTNDRAFLERQFDPMFRSLKFLESLRNQTLVPGYMADQPAPERFAGILPKSISHEGYFPPVHSYWDVLFALKGWKDGAEAARILGRTNEAAWADEQYRLLRQSYRASMDKVVEFKKIDYVPASADYGDADVPSIAFFPCDETDVADPKLMTRSWDRYYNELLDRWKPGWEGGYTPYEWRNVTAFADRGQRDRAKRLLDYLMEGRRPAEWNEFAEVIHSDQRKGVYIGDMPHTWCGSGLINAVRGLLIMETGNKLVLLSGAPRTWLEGNGITLGDMPTYFGKLDLKARMKDNTLDVAIGGAATPEGGFELRWPMEGKPADVMVDGKAWTDFDEKCARLPKTARTVTAKWL